MNGASLQSRYFAAKQLRRIVRSFAPSHLGHAQDGLRPKPASRAHTIACERPLTPSLSKMTETWLRTVLAAPDDDGRHHSVVMQAARRELRASPRQSRDCGPDATHFQRISRAAN